MSSVSTVDPLDQGMIRVDLVSRFMMIGESLGFRPTDFTSGSASSNNNTRNNPILSSSLYDDPMPSRTAGRPSNYFWLNSSPPTPADQIVWILSSI